jgi:DNA-binding NarL/FixJ family response regulator
LVISDVKNESAVLKILERGIQGYLTYECDEDEIIHAIFAISKGEKFYCNKVLDIVFNKHLYNKEDDNCDAVSLTSRETEIARFIASGLTNREVADKIHLSPHTVHTHRKNIMKKLGVRSASELTIYAIGIGLIEA